MADNEKINLTFIRVYDILNITVNGFAAKIHVFAKFSQNKFDIYTGLWYT